MFNVRLAGVWEIAVQLDVFDGVLFCAGSSENFPIYSTTKFLLQSFNVV